MSSSSHDPIAEATRRLRPVLEQAQRMGCQLAERVESQFGPELAGLKQRGDRLLQQLAGGSSRLRERVCADDVKVPRIVKDALGQADSLLGQFARQVANATACQEQASSDSCTPPPRRARAGESHDGPQGARTADGSGGRRRRSRGGRRGPRAAATSDSGPAVIDASAAPPRAGAAPPASTASPAPESSARISSGRRTPSPTDAEAPRPTSEEPAPAAATKP